MEQWSLYNRDGMLTEKVQYRGDPIPKGLYAMGCEVLVRHTDGSYLCMKRSSAKSVYPGFYETSAGGGALWRETPYDCVKRELWEETGIVCDDFILVGKCIDDERGYILYSFTCTVDIDKESIVLQNGETDGYLWMAEKEFIEFINSDKAIDTQRDRFKKYFVSIGYIK